MRFFLKYFFVHKKKIVQQTVVPPTKKKNFEKYFLIQLKNKLWYLHELGICDSDI